MVGPSSVDTQKLTLTVEAQRPAARRELPAPPPGSESGLVSDFDDLKVSARYGGWIPTSDQQRGGKSTASLAAVRGGANHSAGALRVAGEVVAGADFAWAGALFHPGASPAEAVNLSAKHTISFWARGDGGSYSVAVLTESNSGQIPQVQAFAAGPEWKQFTFPLSDFETDGHDITGVGFLRAQEPGRFAFEIDQVEIR